MAKVEIYTSMFCGYCTRAKRLLKQKGVDYANIDVARRREARQRWSSAPAARTTVPQIFINGTHIGGCDEL